VFSLHNDSDVGATLGVWNNRSGDADSSFYVPRAVPAHGTVTYAHRIVSGATGSCVSFFAATVRVRPSGV
ncbi:MAG TPA: hypothetical protein PKI77_11795, partial [Mycobacterium sp.]|nr:hypothetical protein [Mycobacterium sp.]